MRQHPPPPPTHTHTHYLARVEDQHLGEVGKFAGASQTVELGGDGPRVRELSECAVLVANVGEGQPMDAFVTSNRPGGGRVLDDLRV